MDEPIVKTEPDIVEHLGVEVGESKSRTSPHAFCGPDLLIYS